MRNSAPESAISLSARNGTSKKAEAWSGREPRLRSCAPRPMPSRAELFRSGVVECPGAPDFSGFQAHFAFSSDAKLMAWNESGKIHLAETEGGRLLHRLEGEPGPIAFSPDGRRLAVVCPDGTALIFTVPKR